MAKICGKLGVVNDVSDIGMQISSAYSPKNRNIDVSFEIYGKIVKIMGVIQWVSWRKQLKTVNDFGVMITEPPEEYLDFVREISG